MSNFPQSQNSLICLMDAPPILDCSVTPIPGSASSPLQVVALVPRDASKILIHDGTANYIGIYTGNAGSEVLRGIIASGTVYEMPIAITHGSRISLRAIGTSSITSGTLCLTFLA